MAAKHPDYVTEYIVKNYISKTAAEIVDDVMRLYNYKLTENGIRVWISKHGYAKSNSYSEDEELWIINNASNYINSVDMANDFNIMFKKQIKSGALNKKLHALLPDFNFGHSGGRKVGEGFTVMAKPIGSERFTGGYWFIKINNKPISKNYSTEDLRTNWVAKHRYIWELVNNKKVPKGHKVIFLDGDRNNFNSDNLYCIPMKIHAMMIRNDWFTDNRENTLTAIKLCELQFALKERR